MSIDETFDESFAAPADAGQVDRAAGALQENGFTVHVVDTAEQARDLVLGLLPTDQAVFTALSQTLRSVGIASAVDESGSFVSVRRLAGQLADDDLDGKLRLGATPDVVVGSVHAVTEDGRLVVASASGSQLGPYSAGARKAVWVVGAQKVVSDLDTALRRVRTYSLPLERRTWQAQGGDSFIGKILIVEREFLPGRGTVVLVREPIGH
ncbi:hypothetical protein F4553_007583 [Allocatelliglobosispora scoriae]|uniref:LUD domain-containing protein n=1 Tax=Allocatelliglobosispora scoriae TaxID=643052 RepID=A0A841C4C1_9ACTN|nr:LUD domain-containing protein [Allocatelliglobosispora scoriae]MBB5874149.1 hypothetical protein [Allocatelliglobosispora scoriae]